MESVFTDEDLMAKKPKKKQVHADGMKAREFAAALDRLGLSVYASGKVIGLSLRQSQRVAAGESPVPRPVAKLITLLLKKKITVEEATEAG
jgi:hypothetical protein